MAIRKKTIQWTHDELLVAYIEDHNGQERAARRALARNGTYLIPDSVASILERNRAAAEQQESEQHVDEVIANVANKRARKVKPA